MKKKAVLYPLIALLLGAFGAFLHKLQLDTIIDKETGLAERWAPVTIALAALFVVCAIVYFLFALSIAGRDAEPVWSKALAAKTPLPLILSILAFLGMLYGAWYCWYGAAGLSINLILSRILAIFALLAGLGWLLLSVASLRKKGNGFEALSSLVIVLFTCFWLVLSYKEHSADPTRVKYIYGFIGLCAAAIGGYFLAGYAFGRSRPRATIFFCLLAISTCAFALPQSESVPFLVFFSFLVLFLFVNTILLLRNLESPRRAAAPVMEAPEEEPAPEEAPELDFLSERDELSEDLFHDVPENGETPPDLDDILREFGSDKGE